MLRSMVLCENTVERRSLQILESDTKLHGGKEVVVTRFSTVRITRLKGLPAFSPPSYERKNRKAESFQDLLE